MSEDSKEPTRRASIEPGPIALGAGAGMIVGAVIGSAGAGLVLGAAFGLVFPGVMEWMRRKDGGAD